VSMAWIRSLFLFSWLSCIFLSILAADLHGRIEFNDVCPGIEQLGSTKVILDNGRMKGSVMRDGTFTIPNVSAGTYIFSVLSRDYAFDQFRIDILESEPKPEVRPYVAGTPLNPPSKILLSHPITLVPRQKHVYFVPRESFNLMAMFSNPMMLMMVFGGIMVFAMPYIMSNLDPEALQEIKDQNAKILKLQNAVPDGDVRPRISAPTGGESSHPSVPSMSSKTPLSIKSKGSARNRKR